MMRSSSSAATRRHCSAATRRHVVAMGVSPWIAFRRGLSPEGTTRSDAPDIPVAPLGLGACWDAHHGLTPVATACRPVGTESQRRTPRLVAELHAQFAESAKLEQAIKANIRGLGYGG